MSTLKVDTLQTTGGAGLYPAKAWVNFNGTGTVAIRADGNVTSITDNGTGLYTANLTNTMPNSNYEVSGSAGNTSTTATQQTTFYSSNTTPSSPSTTAVGIKVVNGGASAIQDGLYVTFAVHGET